MATNCDGQSLVDAARCLTCQIPPGEQLSVLIYLYCQLAGMQACDGQTLAQAARCLSCQIPPGEQLAVLVYLACQQLAGGGGGGAAIVNTFATPNGNVTGSQGQIYVDSNLQTLWVQENAAGGNTGWVQFV